MIVVIAVQNSQANKKIGDLNFGINNTLQRTNAMLKILNVVIMSLLVMARINFITMSQTIL